METDWTKHWEENYGNFSWKVWIWWMNRAYKKLLKDVYLNKNPKILEIGSGTGINSMLISKVLKVNKITLVDFNQKAFEISRKIIKELCPKLHVKYISRNILDLDLNERFDIVHSEGLIEHFYGKNRLTAFKKHIDFCKEDGFIIILVPYKGIPYSLNKWIYKILSKWIWDEEPFSKQELHKLCRQFNLQIQKELAFPLIHQIGILARKSNPHSYSGY